MRKEEHLKGKEEKKETTSGSGARQDFSRPAPQGGRTESERKKRGSPRGGDRNPRRGRRGAHGEGKSDFAQKVIDVRRVARVVAGGRRFSFSTAVVLGDKNGSVGLGLGKAADTALAIEKATRNARKNMIKVSRTKKKSLPHETRARYCSSDVFIVPAKGRGLVAGSSARTILDYAGIIDVTAKILSRSKNKVNNARATIEALKKIKTAA